MSSFIISLCQKSASLIFRALWQAEPGKAWHGVLLRSVESDLQDHVEIGQGAVGFYKKAPPEHRVDPPHPDLDAVSFGLRIVFHNGASLSDGQRLRSSRPPV